MKHSFIRNLALFIFGTSTLVLLQGCSRDIKGNVYVTLKNHDTKRLSGTTIYLVPEVTVLKWIKEYDTPETLFESIKVISMTNPEKNKYCEKAYNNAVMTIRKGALRINETDVSGQFTFDDVLKENLFLFAFFATNKLERVVLVQRLEKENDFVELNNSRAIFRQEYGQSPDDLSITLSCTQLLTLLSDEERIKETEKLIIDHSPAWKPESDNDFLELKELFYKK